MTIAANEIASLIRQYAGALELYAAQWSSYPADAVQEAFIALSGHESLPENSGAWLYKVVRFKAMDSARAESRRRKYETERAKRTDDWFEVNPYNRLEVNETMAALKALPIDQRETIVARLWGGLSFREIAELTNTSNSTCHRRYQDGIDALKMKLEPSCPTS